MDRRSFGSGVGVFVERHVGRLELHAQFLRGQRVAVHHAGGSSGRFVIEHGRQRRNRPAFAGEQVVPAVQSGSGCGPENPSATSETDTMAISTSWSNIIYTKGLGAILFLIRYCRPTEVESSRANIGLPITPEGDTLTISKPGSGCVATNFRTAWSA